MTIPISPNAIAERRVEVRYLDRNGNTVALWFDSDDQARAVRDAITRLVGT